MDKEKLDRANFLRGKIEDIKNFISVHKNNVRMKAAIIIVAIIAVALVCLLLLKGGNKYADNE